ncbi:four helix bundle protein [Candidatus Peregrinibacteria bacterium]|nr:four helix bundle protein [Candidatus Peregrinibacteria bacterium]
MTTSTSSTIGKKTEATTATKAKEAVHGHQRDLMDRASSFAQIARAFVRRTPKTIASMGDCRRLIRASGEIGSAYLDADKAPSYKDFQQCLRDCCREARQAQHWLALLNVNLDDKSSKLHADLVEEARELEKIFGSILFSTQTKKAA